MTSIHLNEIQNLLEAYQHIFSKGETDLGFNKHSNRIDLLDEEHSNREQGEFHQLCLMRLEIIYRWYWIPRSLGYNVQHFPPT